MGLGIEAIVGIDAEADAGGDVKIVTIDGMGFGHVPQHSSGDYGSIFGLVDFRKQDDKFISSLTANGVRVAHAIHQASGDGLQQFVSGGVTQGVVDMFEAIQIQE